MALNKKPRVLWSRVHFLVRFLGLTGLTVALVGLTLALLDGRLTPQRGESVARRALAIVEGTWELLKTAVQEQSVERLPPLAISLLLAGIVTGLFTLIVEIIVVLRLAAGRHSAFGFNVLVQLALATFLVIGINAYSYQHYLRFDWTKNRQFTLDAQLQKELRQLQGNTTIIVYQSHQSFGQRAQTLDPNTARYVNAAEKKVVEKLKDVIEQFRLFGSERFKIVQLDVEDEEFDRKLDDVTENNPALRSAIEKAPENTIFFVAGRKIQRLSFHELFMLDKEASRSANHGKGNLVLLDQGLAPLTRKILAVDEKRPKIGIAVIHELLTTQGREDLPYTHAGLRKALTARGYDVKDIVLKEWRFGRLLGPSVYTVEDSKLDKLDERIVILNLSISRYESFIKQLHEALNYWKTSSLEKLTREVAEDLNVKKVTEADRREQIEAIEQRIVAVRESIDDFKVRIAKHNLEKASLNVDSLSEQRRLQDLQAKLSQALADCDLLIVPRMTLLDVTEPDGSITNSLHRLDDAQSGALRDFLKQGKPILACFGPTNEPGDRPASPDAMGSDGLERMLEELGIRFVNQTILFDAESEAFAGNRGSPFGGVEVVEVPPVEFSWREGDRPPRLAAALAAKPHPIRESLRLTARCLGRISERDPSGALARTASPSDTQAPLVMDIRLRHPQPVYYEPPRGTKLEADPYFLISNRAGWNEDRPFPSEKYLPSYETLKKDPNQGTNKEKRHGQFPLGVAIETLLPPGWYSEKNAQPATVRLAVIGQGNVFNGSELAPARETLLLDTCNWLLGRDDELTRSDQTWTYPRVQLSEKKQRLWQWGAWVGLPGLFAYLGLVVLLLRRLR